jgi:hypothetical protein
MEQRVRSQRGADGQSRTTPVHLTALALRSIGRVYDMNLSAARVMLQTQARVASAIGLPDWSGLFNVVDERARHVFSSSAEQLLDTTQRANEAATELQREVGRVAETQAATVAQTLQQGFEELGQQANESLNQLVETARQQAEEAERVAQTLNEEMRTSIEQGGEQMRGAMREGGEQVRSEAQRGQEAFGQVAEQPAEEARTNEEKDKAGRRKVSA